MTDESAARAHDDERVPEATASPPSPAVSGGPAPSSAAVDVIAPAAHAPIAAMAVAGFGARSGTALLESPPLGFGGETVRAPLGRGGQASSDPPPFGFNAPGRQRDEEESPGAEAGAPAEVDVDAMPPGAEASSRPVWPRPASPATSRPSLPPRELMPTSIPVRDVRFGEGPAPTFGPPGRRRSVAAMVALTVLTLGLYAVVWHRRVNQEMGDFDPRVHVRSARSAWAVALPLLIGLLASGAAAARVILDHYGVTVHVPVTVAQATFGLPALLAVPYLILVLPFSLVAVAMTAERVRVVEEHAGITADEQIRPAALVGWLVVPAVGGLVVMGRQQSRLNRIWDLARG